MATRLLPSGHAQREVKATGAVFEAKFMLPWAFSFGIQMVWPCRQDCIVKRCSFLRKLDLPRFGGRLRA